jgi:5'(3')-deoxyribonucleotidase
MIALVDVDGVLADFVAGYLALVRDLTGKSFTHADVGEFDMGKALGLSKEELDSVHARIRPGWCRTLVPLPSAQDGMKRLAKCAEVYIITSPWNSCATWMSEREAWLAEHFDIHHGRVLHGSAKHLVRGDVLVDDKTSTCRAWRQAHGRQAVLWSQPWNARDEYAGIRTNDWNKLVAYVESGDIP